MTDLLSVSHAKYQCIYHIQWCSKYRYEVLRKDEYKKEMEEIIVAVAQRHSITVLELAVQSEHVHSVVSAKPSLPITKIVQLLKGASSHEFFARHPNFRLRYPKGHFWSRGKYYGTVGSADLETVRNYVREQTILPSWS